MQKYTEPKQEIKVATDAVCVCTYNSVKYLLLIERQYDPYKNHWALPGGFLLSSEEIEEGMIRELREETNLNENFDDINFIGVFGKIGRDPRKRIISLAYKIDLGTKQDLPEVKPANESLNVEWVKLTSLGELQIAFDHEEIINKAVSLQ
jgi:8-oxo-dGTP diphosphatase